MATGAPRGHITTGIFSTDKVGVVRFLDQGFHGKMVNKSLIKIRQFSATNTYRIFNCRIFQKYLRAEIDAPQMGDFLKNFSLFQLCIDG